MPAFEDQPIVAIACQHVNGETYIFHVSENTFFSHINFQEDFISVDEIYIHYAWFETIIICSEEILQELIGKLEKA